MWLCWILKLSETNFEIDQEAGWPFGLHVIPVGRLHAPIWWYRQLSATPSSNRTKRSARTSSSTRCTRTLLWPVRLCAASRWSASRRPYRKNRSTSGLLRQISIDSTRWYFATTAASLVMTTRPVSTRKWTSVCGVLRSSTRPPAARWRKPVASSTESVLTARPVAMTIAMRRRRSAAVTGSQWCGCVLYCHVDCHVNCLVLVGFQGSNRLWISK